MDLKNRKPTPNNLRDMGQSTGVPRVHDAVRGVTTKQNLSYSAVLGGNPGFKQNLASGNLALEQALEAGKKYNWKRREIILAFNLGNVEFRKAQESCKTLLLQIQNFEVTELIENRLILHINPNSIRFEDIYSVEWDSKITSFSVLKADLGQYIYYKKRNTRKLTGIGMTDAEIKIGEEFNTKIENIELVDRQIDALKRDIDALKDTNAVDSLSAFYNNFEQLHLSHLALQYNFVDTKRYNFPRENMRTGKFLEFLKSNLEKFINPTEEYFE